jgi:GH15 family glucan-1,4-alpha-glucosidase
MVLPMANFLSSFIDRRTNLPKPSYDLWEERFMTTTYTTSVTYAALLAAADLAELRADNDSAVRWRATADDIHEAAQKHLYNESRKAFYKGISVAEDGAIEPDETIDMSSIYGSFMYGLFGTKSEKTRNAVDAALKTFGFDEDAPGLPRYEHDTYRRPDDTEQPNWWFVSSLWMAQYFLETGQQDRATNILHWVHDSAWATGALTEQINPRTRDEMSVSPLCWSQAEYLSTLLDTIPEA